MEKKTGMRFRKNREGCWVGCKGSRDEKVGSTKGVVSISKDRAARVASQKAADGRSDNGSVDVAPGSGAAFLALKIHRLIARAVHARTGIAVNPDTVFGECGVQVSHMQLEPWIGNSGVVVGSDLSAEPSSA